jgi:hypothetical protein
MKESRDLHPAMPDPTEAEGSGDGRVRDRQAGIHSRPDEEDVLRDDPRFRQAVLLFNSADWYSCHDVFEELWHETQGPMRAVLQGILQIAVAHLHLERGNRHGATVLLGEGLGRLSSCGDSAAGLALVPLRRCCAERLGVLQDGRPVGSLPLPWLGGCEWPQPVEPAVESPTNHPLRPPGEDSGGDHGIH